MKILKTTNYGQFRTIRGNRSTNRVHLTKLVKSIDENDMLEANPIIVNERMYVLDGQHRLLAAEKLGVPIYYVVVQIGGIGEVQLLNSNLRAWTMQNFLDSYVERGIEPYVKLSEFIDRTGLSIGLALLLFTGGKLRSGNGEKPITDFKNGDFKGEFKEFAEDVYKALMEVAPFCVDNSWNDREMVMGLITAYRAGIKQEDLIRKLQLSHVRIPRLATRRQYIRVLEDILSFKSKAPARLV